MNPSHPLSGHPFRHALLLATWVACAAPALAQIVADPGAPGSQRPTVLTAPNGVPLVNITTPSAAGVSRNTYRQFDVAPSGAILNNSRTDAPTQLGGWVGANPWLAAGGARVIVNEVNSSQPSRLNGWVEVAGQRAEVVIANPAGIEVNGGGFINASRATLSTGAPVFSAGALEGFRVQGGRVRVEGLGLDATQSDHLTILTRAIEINAGIWAQAITGVSGTNEVSADGSRVTPIAPASGAVPSTTPSTTPSFALDVAAVGGMYAGKIFLIGTEAGLGVNQQGLIDARGPLTLDVNGWLSHTGGARTYGDTVAIKARGVVNEGGSVIAVREQLTIEAAEIHNREGALLLSGGDMALGASERLENRSAAIEALGSLSITTPVLINANDHLSHEVVSDGSTQHTVYYTPAGPLDSADVAWSAPTSGPVISAYDIHRREWLLPRTSPWADPVYRAYYVQALPFVAAHTVESGFGESTTIEHIPDTFTYGPQSRVWADFGLSAPAWSAPGPKPGPTQDMNGETVPVNAAALAEWQARAAPWFELTERVSAFKAQVQAQSLPYDSYVTYTQTTQRAVMTHSEPARITSGADMHLSASQRLLNQDSEIVAGGALHIQGVQADNQATRVSAPTQRSGTFTTWGVTGSDCFLGSCDPEYGWIATPYAETVAREVSLPALRFDADATAAGTTLPGLGSALFIAHPDPDAASAPLLETDPRFTDQRAWLGSEYLLRALAVDPATVQKRLGDGYIEQRLIQEQVGTLTGRRFLGDFTSDEQQTLALMEAGATFARAHDLRPGIALSPEQVASLTSGIVWLVAEEVSLPDGRTTQALVPRVYLLPRPGDLSPEGSLIAGRSVRLHLEGDLRNGGTISGATLVHVDAQGIAHSGRITSQGSTVLQAREDIAITGGTVSAQDALVLQAGRDLSVQTTTAHGQGQNASGVGRYRRFLDLPKSIDTELVIELPAGEAPCD